MNGNQYKDNTFSNSSLHLQEGERIMEGEYIVQKKTVTESQSTFANSLKNYTELFDHAPTGYFILDKKGIIINVNVIGAKQLGVNKTQLIGNYFSTFLNGESCQNKYNHHRNLVIETGALMQMEYEIKKRNGSIYPALVESIAIKDEIGNFKHMLSTMSDISIRKEYERTVELALEKEKELGEMKSRFISMASHEFRTPLSAILSSAWLIDGYNKAEDADKRKKHVDKIKFSVNGLKEILTEFLSINQIEKDLIKNNPATFNLIQFIEDVTAEMNTETRIFTHKHIGEQQHVYLDEKLLKICVVNLLSNAIKYSPKFGTIKITTEINSIGNIMISVKDQGIGIPDNEKCHIFESFFRAENADAIQGTGLGLNIVQRLTMLMDGTVSFESKLNEGTVFMLKFPMKK